VWVCFDAARSERAAPFGKNQQTETAERGRGTLDMKAKARPKGHRLKSVLLVMHRCFIIAFAFFGFCCTIEFVRKQRPPNRCSE